MASLPDGITLDIPDLRVTITPRSDYIVTIQPVDEYHVVTFDTPTVTRATSVFVDYAQSASYANNVASSSYAEVSATSSYADNFVVAGTVTAFGFVGDGSQLTGITAQGTGVTVRDDGTLSGVSQILDFTDGLDVSFVSSTSSISLNRTGSFSGTFSGSQVITGQLTASGLTYPTTDGDAYQMVMTDGAGVLRLDYADRLTLDVKNLDSVQLNKGTPVYIVGFQGDGIYQIAAADASDSDKMPAVGLLADTLAVNDQGHCVLYGALRGIDTQTRSVGDELFVDSGGGLTGSAPSYPALIQKIATVGSVANNGELTILGAGRTNAVPNLATGQIFYGVDNKASTISVTDLLSSNSYIYTGSFTGSFVGDGSGLTDIVSASFATTASYVEGAASDWNTLTNKPAGLVSSSVQINTGSFSGSFTGDGSGLTGLVSASHALTSDTTISSSYSVTASYADNAGVSDWNELTNVPSGLVSSSTQIIANINGQEITPSIISSSGHIVPSTTEIYDLGSTDLRWRDLYLSGSTIYLGNAQLSSIGQLLSGSFTGSFTGDASSITGVVSSSYALTASYADNAGASDWSELTNIPSGIVSSSGQVDHDQTTNYDANEHFTQANITTVGTVTSGDVSAILPAGTVSSSVQVDYTGLSNIPSGIVSSSQQINTGSFSGSFSGDGSGLTGVTGVGSGVEIRDDGAIQGTAQILDFVDGIDATFASSTASISLNRTGSFTGSFSGDASGLTGLVSSSHSIITDTSNFILNSADNEIEFAGFNTTSKRIIIPTGNATLTYNPLRDRLTVGNVEATASVAISSSQAISSSYSLTSSYSETGEWGGLNNVPSGLVSASSQVDYTGLSNVPSGIVSSSTQINTGSFSGSFIGDGSGLTGLVSSSYSLTSSYSETSEWSGLNNVPSGIVSASSQVDYTGLSNVPSGIVSSSGQVDYGGLSNVPSGIVSSSTQFNTLTDPFSGSFTGSFVGDGSSLTGLVSASHALDADNAISASYALTASYAANGGGGGGVTINNNTDNYLVTATGTADTLNGEQFLTWDGVKLTVSSSDDSQQQLQIYAGTQTGSMHVNNGTVYFQGTNSDIRIRHSSGGNNDLVYIGTDFYPAPNGTINFGRNNNR